MTLLHWLRHVRHWVARFPVPGTDYHLWTGPEEGGWFRCFCGAEPPEDSLGETFDEYLERDDMEDGLEDMIGGEGGP